MAQKVKVLEGIPPPWIVDRVPDTRKVPLRSWRYVDIRSTTPPVD